MKRSAAALVVCGCLLATACGGQQKQVHAAGASPLPTGTTSTPAAGTASTPSPGAESAASPSVESPGAGQAPPPAPAPARSPTATSRPDDGAALWDTQWRAVERTRGGKPWPFLDDGGWTARFGGATERVLGWSGACNSTGASVVVAGSRLTVGEPQGSTAMGCEDARMQEDEQATAFFMSDPTWSRRGDTLLLTSGGTSVRLVRVVE